MPGPRASWRRRIAAGIASWLGRRRLPARARRRSGARLPSADASSSSPTSHAGSPVPLPASQKGEDESKLHYWLKIIQSYGADAPVLVVINKCDAHDLKLNETRLKLDYSLTLIPGNLLLKTT